MRTLDRADTAIWRSICPSERREMNVDTTYVTIDFMSSRGANGAGGIRDILTSVIGKAAGKEDSAACESAINGDRRRAGRPIG
jgi:hypothetical protein